MSRSLHLDLGDEVDVRVIDEWAPPTVSRVILEPAENAVTDGRTEIPWP